MTARRASRHACARGEVGLSGTKVTPLWGPRHLSRLHFLTLFPPPRHRRLDPASYRPVLPPTDRMRRIAVPCLTTGPSSSPNPQGHAYCRRMDGPWRGFFARRTLRPEYRSARGVAGRTDARRARRGARVERAPDGAALGSNGVARGRRRHPRRHLQAVRPSPGRRPLAASDPRGWWHPVLEPGRRTAALRPGPHR